MLADVAFDRLSDEAGHRFAGSQSAADLR